MNRTLGAALALALAAGCSAANEYVEPPPPSVSVSQPVRQTVTDYVEFTGRLESVATVEIRARVKGFLKSAPFDEGDWVKEGALLLQIDPAEYEARVAQSVAAVDVATARLELAEATMQRTARAGKTRAVSELEVIESKAKRDEAKGVLAASRADLQNARLDLSYTRITAPISGRVGRRFVDPGNLVGSGENTLLTTIVQYDPIYAYFDVSERELLRLADQVADRPGNEGTGGDEDRLGRLRQIPLEIGRSNDEGFPFPGKVHYADSTVDPETGTLLMRGIFQNPEPVRLFPGVFVRGRMPYREREGALLVSERALGSDQGGRYVLVVDADNVVEHKSVEVGASVEGLRVIESGLEPDDWVVVNGVLRARPGAKVAPERVAPAEPATTSGD
jgi:RND family efflux transporter MFP subunit